MQKERMGRMGERQVVTGPDRREEQKDPKRKRGNCIWQKSQTRSRCVNLSLKVK